MKASTHRDPARGKGDLQFAIPAFPRGGPIPPEHTGAGADSRPLLRVLAVPEGTVSLAFVMDDPDAPVGTFTHWTEWDVDPSPRDIPAGVVVGVQGRNDFGTVGYRGPWPPPGPAHHYSFRAYALDARLGLPSGSGPRAVAAALRPHVLARAEWVGTFSRPA